MNCKLFDFLSEESKVAYNDWKLQTEKRVMKHKMKHSCCTVFYPVFWIDMHLDFLVEIQEELPQDVKSLLQQALLKINQ
jgi:hypothetical protein